MKHGPSVIQKDGRSSQSFVQKEPFNSKLPQQQSTGMNDYESPHQFYKSMNLLQYKQQQQASKSAPSTAPLDKKKNVKSTAQGSTENSTTEESASEDSNQAMDSDIEITGFTMSGTTASMGASTCRPSHGKVSSLAQEVSSFSVAKMPTATLPPSSALPKGSLIPAAPATSAQITNSSIPQATNNAAAELTRKRAIFPPFFIISPELEKLFESGLRRTRDLEEIVCPVAIPDKSHFWSVLTEFEAETRLGKRRRILL